MLAAELLQITHLDWTIRVANVLIVTLEQLCIVEMLLICCPGMPLLLLRMAVMHVVWPVHVRHCVSNIFNAATAGLSLRRVSRFALFPDSARRLPAVQKAEQNPSRSL
jgi:hypothetical protein